MPPGVTSGKANVMIEYDHSYVLLLASANLSVIPITEGEKKPHQILGSKHDLLTRCATQEEVKKWIEGGVKSWGIAGGAVSRNLVTLDFDEKHYLGLYDLWYARLSDDLKKIVDTCYKNSTRNGGTHLRYRVETTQPTIKLARRVEFNKKINKEEIVTTAETRAEGSYALIPPSAGYETIQGNLLELPTVSGEIHEELIDILRTFNEVEDEPVTEYEWKENNSNAEDRPGDRFNQRATWKEILEPHGWTEETRDHWRRPGKDKGEGISATTNYENIPMLYVFSSSAAPFMQNRGYSKFHAFALLNHNGDYKVAAKVAAEMYPQEQSDTEIQKETVIEKCNLLLKEISPNTPKESILHTLTPVLKVLVSGTSQEEAEIYIRNKIKDELDIKTKDIDSIIKHFKKMKLDFVIKTEIAKKEAEKIKEEVSLTEEEKQNAEYLLKSPKLFFDILNMVKKLGVVGEEKNVLLHYIIFTSRNLEKPLSATVKGDSSSGKSYTLLTTMKLFPKSAYIDLTDATPQSFFYCPEDHFKHKIIVIFEKHGGERADYAIRTLQSEGKLKIQVTVKNPDTGQFEAQTIEKEGPTGFVTTTTASFIHSENDTRNISMFPDQSSEQTSRVYESVDSRYLGIQPINSNELLPWHHAQILLEKLPVYIPFAKSFRKYFPNYIVRTRRDYSHFLAIVETVAFLHQKQRSRVDLNGTTYIRASLADAHIAKVIVEDSLSKSIFELPEKTIEVIKTAKILIEEVKKDKFDNRSDENKMTFTISKLAKKLSWDGDTVRKWAKPALKKGYFTISVDSKGPKGAEYKLEEKELPEDSFLPSLSEIITDNPNESIENIYNPLTGEIITAEMISTDAPTVLEEDKNIQQDGEKNTSIDAIGASVEEKEKDNPRKMIFDSELEELAYELRSIPEQDEDGVEIVSRDIPF